VPARPFRIQLAARSGIHFEPSRSQPLDIHFSSKHVSPKHSSSKGPCMHVEIERRDELRVATVRHTGPYNRISEACARIGEIAGAAGIIDSNTVLLAIYHDDPETTPIAELCSEAAISVSHHAHVPPELGERRIAAGRYAVTTHVGSYEQLGDVWARLLGEWLPESGERMTDGVSFELYRNTPGQVPESELVTELYIPLA
jgi:AraC family transcriptional regulator